MWVPVQSVLGLAGIPSHRSSATRWFAARGILTDTLQQDGRRPEVVLLSNLPADVRRAYELREIEAAGLPAGDYDDAAHERFAEATTAMQVIALRKAEIARFLVKAGAGAAFGLSASLVQAVRQQFGSDGTDRMTLRRILRAVEGVAPINFAPTLMPEFSRGGRPQDKVSAEAWSFFMTTIRDAGPQFRSSSLGATSGTWRASGAGNGRPTGPFFGAGMICPRRRNWLRASAARMP